MTKKELGNRLIQVREKMNMTQKEIAKKIEIAEQAYQRYEYGTVEPKILIMIKLADKLNVSLDYLTGRSDDDSPFRVEPEQDSKHS